MKSKLAQNIKAQRIKNHMEQSELASKLHISNKTVSSWECGRTEPKMGMIEDMCNVFGCTKQELLDGYQAHERSNSLSNVEWDLIIAYRQANDGIKDSVLKLLDVQKRDADILNA